MHKIISTSKAPKAIGAYSQAILIPSRGLIFTAGQIPLNPQTMEIVSDDITSQTAQVINNLKSILEAADCTLANVVKTTIFLKNMDDFILVNAEYERHFGEHKPARSTVEVSRLPKNAKVEIEAVAFLE